MNWYNTVIYILTALMLLVMTFLIYENSRFDKRTKKKYYLTFFVIFIAMFAEWASIMLNGAPEGTIEIHKIVKCVDYIFTPVTSILVIAQISKWNRVQKALGVLLLLNACFQIGSFFWGWTFYIDESNIYHHGPAYPVYTVVYLIPVLVVFVELYFYGKRYTKQNRLSLFAISVLVTAGIVIQETMRYRVSYLALAAGAVFIFIHCTEYSQQQNDADLMTQKKLLRTDTLTGLYSRYAYTDDLRHLNDPVNWPTGLVIFSVDVNELKTVNDTLGHLAGDELIRGAAKCIRSVLGEYGKCYRTGGDEFISILSVEEKRAYELKLELEKAAENWRGELSNRLSLAIGYVIANNRSDSSIEKIINLADEKMYEDKARFYMQEGHTRRKTDVKQNDAIEFRQKEYMDIISALASDVTGLYMLDREKKEVTAYRISSSDHRVRSGVPLQQGFETAMNFFIEKNVHADDKELMKQNIKVSFIERELAAKGSYMFHFRTVTNGEIHFHSMKCLRNIPDEHYDKILISFSPEDNFIRMKMMVDSLSEIGIDDLTRVYTKQAFQYHAKQYMESGKEETYTVIITDILNFKMYNSVYGENSGDQLLRTIADFLRKTVSGDVYGRYGADQFVILQKNSNVKDALYYPKKLQDYIRDVLEANVVLKFGIYEKIDTSLDIARICDRALLALKSVKNKYEDAVGFFDGPVNQQLLKEQTFEARFRKAIANQEFIVWYQPKYNPYTEKVVGAEALVRWKTSDGNMISPGDFIPVFERDGLISQLDEYVFREVCKFQKKQMQRRKEWIPISVNLSRKSMHQKDIAERYKSIADSAGILPEMIPIEITESTAVSTIEIKPLADAFYESGFPLHMDDFGSGHSSLTGLNMLHFDVVKLDKSLIDYIGDEHGNLVLMYTIALGKELGLHLVAEGVETEEQVSYLKDNGCETVQGYYYSKPLPEEEFVHALEDNLESDSGTYDYRYKLTASDSVIKRAMDRMLQRMPGGFFTYRAGGDERIISSNAYLWNLYGCQNESEFMDHVGGSFKGMVCPEDLKHVEEYIEQQIAGDKNRMDYVEYRIVRKDGTRCRVVDYGHLDKQPDGDIFYVFISEADH